MMSPFRTLSLAAHGVVETLAAPLIMVAPFLLGFSVGAGIVAVAFGALLLGLALSTHADRTHADRPAIPLSSHAAFDYALGFVALVAGIAAAVFGGGLAETIFFVGIGSAHLALTANTRFIVPREA
jgi:hypothetical protein